MANAVQILLIFLASVLVGLWGCGMLMDTGLLHGFEAEAAVAVCIAAAYALVQCLFHGGTLLLKPARGAGVLIAESLSQLSALILILSLAHVRLPLPSAASSLPALVTPLLYFALFAGLHLFFKLMFFFAAVQGTPVSRAASLFWFLPAGLSVVVMAGAAGSYLLSLEKASLLEQAMPEQTLIGDIVMTARLLPEKKALLFPMKKQPGRTISLFFALPPELKKEVPPLFVRIRSTSESADTGKALFRAAPSRTTRYRLAPVDGAWNAISFDSALLAPDTASILVDWTEKDPADWRARLGLKKTPVSSYRLWVADPVIQ